MFNGFQYDQLQRKKELEKLAKEQSKKHLERKQKKNNSLSKKADMRMAAWAKQNLNSELTKGKL